MRKQRHFRSRLLEELDTWAHERQREGVEEGEVVPLTWWEQRICDAWEYHVTGGEMGRWLWPLTRWKYEPVWDPQRVPARRRTDQDG